MSIPRLVLILLGSIFFSFAFVIEPVIIPQTPTLSPSPLFATPSPSPLGQYQTASPSSAKAYAQKLISKLNVPAYVRPTQAATEVIAIGDSFTAGIGSNYYPQDMIIGSFDCQRYKKAWPLQLGSWDRFNGGKSPEINFGACSAATMQSLKELQLKPGTDWRDHHLPYSVFGKPQLAMLTISGNDADFGEIINSCIYRAWRPKNCASILSQTKRKINSIDFQDQLIDVLSTIALRGRGQEGANPANSFQTYISGYVPFWNTEERNCDQISWSWWLWDRAFLKKEIREEMNNLVDDINGQIKSAAEALSGLGVFYVEGFQSFYDGHQFCQPGGDDYYLTHPVGSQTWFWHQDSPLGSGEDGGGSFPGFAKQAVLDLLIPDKNQQRSISLSNPPWNITSAFDNQTSFYAALYPAMVESLYGTLLDPSEVDTLAASLLTKRSFHPKGTAYAQHAAAFLAAFEANRGPITQSQAPSTCIGNQVQNNCTAGTLPSSPPFSGLAGPSCVKALGNGGPYTRINAGKAEEAAAQYCSNLISSATVLSTQFTTVNPGTVPDAAEGGTTLALSVIFDVSYCPSNHSMTELDFSIMSQDDCILNLFTPVSEVCAQDPTWEDYNPDYTLEGGSFGNDCAIWSMIGEGGT